MNTELRPIHLFTADGTGAEKCFHDLIKFALTYRYRRLKSFAIQINDQILTKVIFGFSAKDRIPVWDGLIVSGQEFEELFISSVFLKVIEDAHKGKKIGLALPFKTESYDTVIFGFQPGKEALAGTKLLMPRTPEDGFSLRVQVKQDYDHDDLSKTVLVPQPFDPTNLERYTEEYSEFVLVFIRRFAMFSSEQVSELMESFHLGLIHSFNEEVVMHDHETDEPKRRIVPRSNAFNFLVQVSDRTHHVSYSFPPFLVKDADLQKQLKQRYQR